MVIYNPGSAVRFNESMYRVIEDDELVQPALVLNNPSSSAVTVQVNDDSITATGELINIMSHKITLMVLQKVMIMILDHILLTSLLEPL